MRRCGGIEGWGGRRVWDEWMGCFGVWAQSLGTVGMSLMVKYDGTELAPFHGIGSGIFTR